METPWDVAEESYVKLGGLQSILSQVESLGLRFPVPAQPTPKDTKKQIESKAGQVSLDLISTISEHMELQDKLHKVSKKLAVSEEYELAANYIRPSCITRIIDSLNHTTEHLRYLCTNVNALVSEMQQTVYGSHISIDPVFQRTLCDLFDSVSTDIALQKRYAADLIHFEHYCATHKEMDTLLQEMSQNVGIYQRYNEALSQARESLVAVYNSHYSA
mmetsp:Transcript_37977/g.74708  ORF Transcript_37977/g.74708 Transcript_37977/m.74708 type:complete len:217 (-) Transcript_37977:272-922(-)|eukprot:CAMPEP_0175149788 /NCGR_PEP_ID=MMETSP0087-20121206/17462_1 /TAXON_ID=136419 /ORGANISM="Unknown Unknown, Strain D1" /LENGTH=216 /DNA_ID=CAMNT_0016435567 /DNA_START=38 /DNA_END=688 /DNA_ORIENTATION=-